MEVPVEVSGVSGALEVLEASEAVLVVLRQQLTPLFPHLRRLMPLKHPPQRAEAILVAPAQLAQTASSNPDRPTPLEGAKMVSWTRAAAPI